MADTFYITTPLYYVNNEPHVGHAYTTILADVLTRFKRLFGEKAHFLTGLDEHGQKVADAAAERKMNPQDHCDEMAKTWSEIWAKLNIRYDDFIRTTEPRHESVVVDILKKLYKQGDVYQQEYEGWYSVFEERFFTEKDLIDGKDPIGGREVERLKEKNYFFKMSQYQEWLIDHYEKHPDSVVPEFRLNEVKGFLRQPLGDLCISRPKSRLNWGIEIPWDKDYVTYVWFDALINYYSATVNPPSDSDVSWPADCHLIAKDILTTHAVYWPIMLHAAGLEPPKTILSHGYWLSRGETKMSKSIGNVVQPMNLAGRLGVDAFRYVLMREMSVGQDANFSFESFVDRINTDLANDLGNLYSRLAKVWQTGKYGSVKPPEKNPAQIPSDLAELRKTLYSRIKGEIDNIKPHLAIEEAMKVVRGLNQLIEQLKPWKVVKTEPESIAGALAWALDALRDVAGVFEPIMPEKMAELKNRIGDDAGLIQPKVGKPLFPRLKIEDIVKTDSAETKREEQSVDKTNQISIEEFARTDLRIGKILDVKKHEKADKLLIIQVDAGGAKRQIVAGLAKAYQPDDLIGKRVVVVCNLKPVKLRGEISQGMLLAATGKDGVYVLSPDGDPEPGSKVK